MHKIVPHRVCLHLGIVSGQRHCSPGRTDDSLPVKKNRTGVLQALVTTSVALVPSSFLLLQVRHLLVLAWHLFLVASCYY